MAVWPVPDLSTLDSDGFWDTNKFVFCSCVVLCGRSTVVHAYVSAPCTLLVDGIQAQIENLSFSFYQLESLGWAKRENFTFDRYARAECTIDRVQTFFFMKLVFWKLRKAGKTKKAHSCTGFRADRPSLKQGFNTLSAPYSWPCLYRGSCLQAVKQGSFWVFQVFGPHSECLGWKSHEKFLLAASGALLRKVEIQGGQKQWPRDCQCVKWRWTLSCYFLILHRTEADFQLDTNVPSPLATLERKVC